MAKFQEIESAVASLDKQVKQLTKDLQSLVNSVNKQSKSQVDLSNNTKKVTGAVKQVSVVEKELENVRRRSLKVTKEVIAEKEKLRQKTKALTDEVRKEQGTFQKSGAFFRNQAKAIGAAALAYVGFQKVIQGVGKVINSTQKSGDAFAITIQGMKSAYDAFNKSLASGDLKNVFKNMKEAFQAGKEYAAMLDDLGDRERGLKVIRAESQVQIEKLTNTVQNVTLANEDRIAAAKKIFDIEKSLLAQTQDIRKQDFEAQRDILAKLTKWDEDKVLSFIKNYDAEKAVREQAIAFIKQNADIEAQIASKQNATFDADYDRRKRLEKGIKDLQQTQQDLYKDTDKTIKDYAVIYKSYSDSTDTELNRVVDSYVALQDAESSSVAGLRRITNQYNTLLQKIEGERINSIAEVVEREVIQLEELNAIKAESVQSQNELSIEALEERLIKEYELKQASAQKDIELTKLTEEQKDQIKQAAIDTAFSIANSLIEIQRNKAESEIMSVEAERDAKIDAAEKSGKDTTKIKQKYDKKIAKLKTDQAKKDKNAAIIQATIDTALSVVKTLAAYPYPANLILAALSAVAGGVEIAAIESQPLPKFKHGTNGQLQLDTTAIVGDGGKPELITTPQGSFISPSTDTMVHLPRGSQVFSGDSPETKAALSGGMSVEMYNGLINEQRLTRKAIQSKSITKEWTSKGLLERDNIRKIDRLWVDKYMR